MKKFVILSMITVLLLAFVQLPAQDITKKGAIKSEIKDVKEEVKAEKKELKVERKSLRKLEGSEVPQMSKNAFHADFGNVKAENWKRNGYFDEVIFMQDGKEMKAFYDFDSKLVGTTSVKTFSDLPEKGQKEINSRYRDYQVDKVILFEDNEINQTDMLLWDVQFEDADNYFVELSKPNEHIILQVNPRGDVYFLKKM